MNSGRKRVFPGISTSDKSPETTNAMETRLLTLLQQQFQISPQMVWPVRLTTTGIAHVELDRLHTRAKTGAFRTALVLCNIGERELNLGQWQYPL
jgi:hypothetical protein